MEFFVSVVQGILIYRRKNILLQEKLSAIQKEKGGPSSKNVARKLDNFFVKIKFSLRNLWRKISRCPEGSYWSKFGVKVKHNGTLENYVLKSIAGFLGGFLLTYIFFMFLVITLNFKISTATTMCSVVGCVLTIGLAFSQRVRCVVFMVLPQFFTQKGRQALLAYAFVLALTGPAKNTLNNMGILSESLACGQEQLRVAAQQIMEVIKKPYYAIRDAIKEVVKIVKLIVKKIKEVFLTIKRIVLGIAQVIKSAFQFLGKIFNICSKKVGTPFERCQRMFEDAVIDCHAKLGPMFSWLCSITYVTKAVCYIVKPLDFICMLIEFISDSVIFVIIRKIRIFIRHIRTIFYVRIRFSHSFQFETKQSKKLSDITESILLEIKERGQSVLALLDLMSCATSLFFTIIIVNALYYRYKFLTVERYDNRYITKDFRQIDFTRAQLEKETVLPLNHREKQNYGDVRSCKLVEREKRRLSKSLAILMSSTFKLGTHMLVDYGLYWILATIRYHGRVQTTVETPKVIGIHIEGAGFIADLYRSIVKAFRPLGLKMDVDTVPCLPDPIPPDFDRYLQIAFLVFLCWILAFCEPYGLRFRHYVMCYYNPIRARERAIWLYNHILRGRNGFLKFARRQLRRKVLGMKGITKITCLEYLRSRTNNRCVAYFLGESQQQACLLCGEVFRPEDPNPFKCPRPGCPGIYCQKCFKDLKNLCTVCLEPLEYGDLSDMDEEKDSSEDENSSKYKRRQRMNESDESEEDEEITTPNDQPRARGGYDPLDSDYSTNKSDTESICSSEFSYSYQYQNNQSNTNAPLEQSCYFDVEKQFLPDYASMETFSRNICNEDTEEEYEEEDGESHLVHRKPRSIKRNKSKKLQIKIYYSSDSEEVFSLPSKTEFTRITESNSNFSTYKKLFPKPKTANEVPFIELKSSDDEIITKPRFDVNFVDAKTNQNSQSLEKSNRNLSRFKKLYQKPKSDEESLIELRSSDENTTKARPKSKTSSVNPRSNQNYQLQEEYNRNMTRYRKLYTKPKPDKESLAELETSDEENTTRTQIESETPSVDTRSKQNSKLLDETNRNLSRYRKLFPKTNSSKKSLMEMRSQMEMKTFKEDMATETQSEFETSFVDSRSNQNTQIFKASNRNLSRFTKLFPKPNPGEEYLIELKSSDENTTKTRSESETSFIETKSNQNTESTEESNKNLSGCKEFLKAYEESLIELKSSNDDTTSKTQSESETSFTDTRFNQNTQLSEDYNSCSRCQKQSPNKSDDKSLTEQKIFSEVNTITQSESETLDTKTYTSTKDKSTQVSKCESNLSMFKKILPKPNSDEEALIEFYSDEMSTKTQSGSDTCIDTKYYSDKTTQSTQVSRNLSRFNKLFPKPMFEKESIEEIYSDDEETSIKTQSESEIFIDKKSCSNQTTKSTQVSRNLSRFNKLFPKPKFDEEPHIELYSDNEDTSTKTYSESEELIKTSSSNIQSSETPREEIKDNDFNLSQYCDSEELADVQYFSFNLEESSEASTVKKHKINQTSTIKEDDSSWFTEEIIAVTPETPLPLEESDDEAIITEKYPKKRYRSSQDTFFDILDLSDDEIASTVRKYSKKPKQSDSKIPPLDLKTEEPQPFDKIAKSSIHLSETSDLASTVDYHKNIDDYFPKDTKRTTRLIAPSRIDLNAFRMKYLFPKVKYEEINETPRSEISSNSSRSLRKRRVRIREVEQEYSSTDTYVSRERIRDKARRYYRNIRNKEFPPKNCEENCWNFLKNIYRNCISRCTEICDLYY